MGWRCPTGSRYGLGAQEVVGAAKGGVRRQKEKPQAQLGALAGWRARGTGVPGCGRPVDRVKGTTEDMTKVWPEKLGGKPEGVEP